MKNIPTFADFILLGKKFLYLWHRLKFFLLNSLIKAVFTGIDVYLIFNLIPNNFRIKTVSLRICLIFLEKFWWGGLEIMRSSVRKMYPNKNNCMNSILRWTYLSFFLSIAVVFYTFFLVMKAGFNLFSFYCAVLLLSSAIKLPIKTLHSGIYAISRLHRPFWTFWLPSLFFILLALSTKSLLDRFSWPTALLLSNFLRYGLISLFLFKKYKFLNFLPAKYNSFLFTFPEMLKMDFWIGGISYAFSLVHLWLVMTIFLLFDRTETDLRCLIDPPILAGFIFQFISEWAQLFYFDFEKTSFSSFFLGKKIHQLAICNGVALVAALYLFNTHFHFWSLASGLIFLNLQLVYLYVMKMYLRIIFFHFFIIFWGFLTLNGFISQEISILLFLTIVAATYFKPFSLKRFSKPIALFDFFHFVSSLDGYCRLGKLTLSFCTTSCQQRTIAELLLNELKKRGAVSMEGKNILWVETNRSAPISTTQICSLGNGCIRNINYSEWKSNGKALLLLNYPIENQEIPSTEEIIKNFQKQVPEDEGIYNNGKLEALIVKKAYGYLHFLQPSKPIKNKTVTTLYHPYENKYLVFLLSANKKSIYGKKWKRQIHEWNQQWYIQKILEKKVFSISFPNGG